MDELITKHLSSEYKVVSHHEHFKIVDNYGDSVKGYEISEYISETFGTSILTTIELVKKWLRLNGLSEDDISLITFDRTTLIFPIVQQVAARTLALDLVRVEPLSTPVGKLFYFIPKESKWKRFWKKCWMWIKRIFIK